MALRLFPVVAGVLVVAVLALAATRETQDQTSPILAPHALSVARTLQVVDAATSYVVLPAGTPHEVSGMAWAGDDLFYGVSDSNRAVHPFTIRIDRADGRILSVTRGTPVALFDEDGRPSGGSDLEGITFDAARSTITVVNESGLGHPRRSILTYRAADGRFVDAIDTTGTHFDTKRMRGGLGLESLARLGDTIWTANEEALNGDGPRSSEQQGTLVRLTRFDAGQLTGQWAYATDRTGGNLPNFNINMGGVVELVALADNRLLVLERATSASEGPDDLGGFLSRIYLVDIATGTNIVRQPALELLTAGTDYRLVNKQLLWSRRFALTDSPMNFEGMALGPVLDDGSRSLILVSDNEMLPSALWALRLSAVE